MEQQQTRLDEKINDLDERSEAAQEILEHMPNWIIRWGITVFFVALLAIFCLAWFIRYPEVLTAKVVLVTETPSAKVVAKSSGHLIRLLVQEGQKVSSQDTLAVIQSSVDYDEFIQLESLLDQFKKEWASKEQLPSIPFDKNLLLGDLQAYYSNFLEALSDYQSFLEKGYYRGKIESFERELSQYKSMTNIYESQLRIAKQEADLAERKYNANQKLFEKGLYSATELDTTLTFFLSKQRALNDTQSQALHNKVQMNEIVKQIEDLKFQDTEKRRTLANNLRDAMTVLSSHFSAHEQTYILKAPINGTVSFFNFWSQNQYVTSSQEVMTIYPEHSKIEGKAYIRAFGSGKLKQGQRVNIKLDDYPYKEFGMLAGVIQGISTVSREGQYLVSIDLPDEMKTSFNKNIQFRQNMEGSAEVITEKLRLIERIFGQIAHVFKDSLSD